MKTDLSKWSPFGGLDKFRQEMDDLMNRFFRRETLPRSLDVFMPAVDIFENPDEVLCKIEIPGMKPEEIDVTVSGATLTVKGERRTEKKGEEEGVFHQERHYGSFLRTLTLPCEVKEADTTASYENGVLEITLPKAEEARAKKIEIKPK